MNAHELLCCPACSFDRAAFEKHMEAMKHSSHPITAEDWDRYKPIIYRARPFSEWVVECQSCGMVVLLNNETEEGTVDIWNDLPRKQETT